MFQDELTHLVLQAFGFEPTAEQMQTIRTFAAFMADREQRPLMIMRGAAGTGKTALAGAIVRALTGLKQRVVLLAPTGRAAKVFGLRSGRPASTIHRRIYREQRFTGTDSRFNLNVNLAVDTLFMVDESSMIANGYGQESAFGSGRLLDDLVQYVYSGRGCRLMLIGDKAQLPPVGETESPALSADAMKGYGLHVWQCDLTEVLRQNQHSGILFNATQIRHFMTQNRPFQLPKVCFSQFTDIQRVTGNDLIDSLESAYSRDGADETIVITRSNKRANIYNQGIRNTVLDYDSLLCRGDMCMVVHNNYYWIEREKQRLKDEGMEDEAKNLPISFLANGDRAKVTSIHNVCELYGFHFADAWLVFPDYDNYELQATVILDSLTTEAPALTKEQSDKLFNAVMNDYADVPTKAERLKDVREDEYFNALQIKYAYAMTCHKAQGGQWTNVFIDQGYMTDDMITPDYLHWLYTAFTRATDKLYLVNWPKTQIEGDVPDEW